MFKNNTSLPNSTKNLNQINRDSVKNLLFKNKCLKYLFLSKNYLLYKINNKI